MTNCEGGEVGGGEGEWERVWRSSEGWGGGEVGWGGDGSCEGSDCEELSSSSSSSGSAADVVYTQ